MKTTKSKNLVTIGKIGRFHPLKTGKIHMRCRRCKYTRSNMEREDFDPENAVVMVGNFCPRCDKGGDFEEFIYYDSQGEEITNC